MAYRWELTNEDGQTKFSLVPKKKKKKQPRNEKRKKKERTDISIEIPFSRVKNFDQYHV